MASGYTTGDVDADHEAEAPGPGLGFEGAGLFLRGYAGEGCAQADKEGDC